MPWLVTVQIWRLFIALGIALGMALGMALALALAACAGPATNPGRSPELAPAITPPDAPALRSPLDATIAGLRGAACATDGDCRSGLTCETGFYATGGYCASSCEACDGACVGTPRGERCMAACASDAECRVTEGYVCDRQWKACTLPNSTAIVPKTCRAPSGIGRDPGFSPTVRVDDVPVSPIAGAGVEYTLLVEDGLRVRSSRDQGKTVATALALVGGRGNATLGADGRLHVVGIDGGPLGGYGSANQRIQYTVSGDGGRTFARPITVSRRDEVLPFYFSNPSVAVDTRRKWLYVAYVRGGRDAVWDIVLAASKDNGTTWKRARIGDDPGCAIHLVPNLALDAATGSLHVAWYDGRGEARFAHAICAPGLAKCTQTGRINDQPFAVLSTVRNAPASLGDAASLVVDAKRRLLLATWRQPVVENGSVITRVFQSKAKLPLR